MLWLGIAIGAVTLIGVGLMFLLIALWVNPPLPRHWRPTQRPGAGGFGAAPSERRSQASRR